MTVNFSDTTVEEAAQKQEKKAPYRIIISPHQQGSRRRGYLALCLQPPTKYSLDRDNVSSLGFKPGICPAPPPHSLTKTLLKRLSHFKERREETSSTPTCPINASTPRVPGAASDTEGTAEPPNPDGVVAVHDSWQNGGTV